MNDAVPMRYAMRCDTDTRCRHVIVIASSDRVSSDRQSGLRFARCASVVSHAIWLSSTFPSTGTYPTQASTMRISPFAASMFLVSATLGASARRGVASAFVAPSSSATVTTASAVRRQFGGSAAVLAAEKSGGDNQQQPKQKQGGKFK